MHTTTEGEFTVTVANINRPLRTTAISLKPNYADAYNNSGIAYFNQGNNELGCRDAQKSCELRNCKTLELAKGKGDCR
jgi:hypothetical protein